MRKPRKKSGKLALELTARRIGQAHTFGVFGLLALLVTSLVIGSLLNSSSIQVASATKQQRFPTPPRPAPLSMAIPPTVQLCKQYSRVDYYNTTLNPIDYTTDVGIPPLLLSYPGAGNTFVRTLLEYATGLHSCSIYMTDKELQVVFPGEHICDRKCGVIKGHPTDFIIKGQMDLKNQVTAKGDKRDKLRGTSKFMRRKCAKGGIQHFSKAIFLARDPFPSILSDFQRVATNSHEGTLTLSMNETFHLRNVKRNPIKDKNMTEVWLNVAMEKATDIGSSFDSVLWELFQSNYSAPPTGNKNSKYPHLDFTTYFLRYEDLIDKERRVGALEATLREAFPHLSVPKERIECAFVLADHKRDIQRTKKLLTMDEVYNNVLPSLPCSIWKHTRNFAQNFSYFRTPNPHFTSIAQQCQS